MAQKTTFTIVLPNLIRPVSEYTDLCNALVAGIGGNPLVFVTPNPTLAALTAKKDALEAADLPSNIANTASRNAVKKHKKELLVILKQLAAYVIGVAASDRSIAELSGFKLSKEETSIVHTGNFSILDTKPGSNDGEAIVRLDDKGGYTMFTVERKMPDNSWVMIGAFQLMTMVLKGLPSGSSIVRITGFKSDVPGMVIEIVVKAV